MFKLQAAFLVWSAVLGLACTEDGRLKSKKNESQLIKDLFSMYDPLVWPNRNHSSDWSVKVDLDINYLVDLNEKQQVLSLTAVFSLLWKEPLLSWDPEDYNTEVLYVPPSMMWKPDIIIMNAVKNYGQIGQEMLRVFIESGGHVGWLTGDFYKLYCKVDVRRYPFDIQTCRITLNPWSCPRKILNLDLYDTEKISLPVEENGEWKLISIKARKVWVELKRHYRLEFSLVLKRKTLFYVVNMILPIVFLSMLNSLTFALPVNSGEKMTLCISVLLSYAVFLTLVNDALPENSDGVCFFSAYLATEIFMSAAATILTVFILSFYHQTPKAVRARRWMTWMLPEPKKVQDKVWAIKNLQVDPEEMDAEEDGSRIVSRSEVARALDKLCLRVFSAANIIITFAFFCAMNGIV